MLQRFHDLFRLRTNPLLFFSSSAIMLVFVVITLIIPEQMGTFWSEAAAWIFEYFGWFFVFGVTIFLIFLVYIGLSRFGRLKLGADEEKPQHSDMAWFGMLFAAGSAPS